MRYGAVDYPRLEQGFNEWGNSERRTMQIVGSETERNLKKLLADELYIFFRYGEMAQAAKEAGQEELADIYLATAQNEMEHARHSFRFLEGVQGVKANLETAILREHEESEKVYPEAAKVAEREGFTEIAEFFRRLAGVEASHAQILTKILETMERGEEIKGRTVGHSRTYMAQMMLPDQANPAGNVHGGELMKLMDNAAGVAAVRHCHTLTVTAAVDEITFLNPVKVGDLVIVHSRLVFVSHSSATVRVEVYLEKLFTEAKLPTHKANFVMVAVDEQGTPVAMPPLIISTEEEQKLFNEAQAKYEARKRKR
jgi:acyl-CoA hydrolase/ferritin